jgi:hypothetical protein
MRYVGNPVEVDAIAIDDILYQAENDWSALPLWLVVEYEAGNVVFEPEQICINTLEGQMTGDAGDMLIKGTEGEIYPCKKSIFDKKYTAVE